MTSYERGRKTLEELSIAADSEPYILRRDQPAVPGDLAIHPALVVPAESSDDGVMTCGFSLGNQAIQMSLGGGRHET